MGVVYGTQTILVDHISVPVQLAASMFYQGSPTPVVQYVEIEVVSESIIFTVDGSDPYSSHCLYGLQFVSQAWKGDVIYLDSFSEIANFKAVKDTPNNAFLSVLYYKES